MVVRVRVCGNRILCLYGYCYITLMGCPTHQQEKRMKLETAGDCRMSSSERVLVMQIRRSWHGFRSPHCDRYSTALLDLSRWRMAVSLGPTFGSFLDVAFSDELYSLILSKLSRFPAELYLYFLSKFSPDNVTCIKNCFVCVLLKWWYSKRLGQTFEVSGLELTAHMKYACSVCYHMAEHFYKKLRCSAQNSLLSQSLHYRKFFDVLLLPTCTF